MKKCDCLLVREIGIVLILCFLVGCTNAMDPDEAIAKVNENNIQRLANLYFTFQMKHEWRGPTEENEFKKFIRTYNPKKLQRIGIDPKAIDELFVNERDGQPFKIRYSVRGSSMGSSEPVIFEAEGIGDKRLVGFLNMEQRQVDDEEYEDLWNGASQPKQRSREAVREN